MSLKKSSSGFTLIELIIAATILILAGVAGILAEKSYIQSSSLSKHKLEATAAAQEGISAVKKVFNNNLLTIGSEESPWTIGAVAPNVNLSQCETNPCSLDNNGNLVANPNGDTFVRDGITFTRKIYVYPPD